MRMHKVAPPGEAALTCHHLTHPLHRIHHALALRLALDRWPLAAQDLAVWYQAHHQLVPYTGCLHTVQWGSAPAGPPLHLCMCPLQRCLCLCETCSHLQGHLLHSRGSSCWNGLETGTARLGCMAHHMPPLRPWVPPAGLKHQSWCQTPTRFSPACTKACWIVHAKTARVCTRWVRPRLVAIAGCLCACMLVNKRQASQSVLAACAGA